MSCNQARVIQLELQLLPRYLTEGMAGQQKRHRLKLPHRLFLRKYSWWHTLVLDLANHESVGLGFEVPPMFPRSDIVQKSPAFNWAFLIPNTLNVKGLCVVGLVRFELTTKGL